MDERSLENRTRARDDRDRREDRSGYDRDRERGTRRDDRRDERDRRDRDDRRRDDRDDHRRDDRERNGDSRRRDDDRMYEDRKYADSGKRDRAHDDRDDRRRQEDRDAPRKQARRDETPPPDVPDFYFTASQIAGRICELFPHLSQKLPFSRDFRDCFLGVGTIPGGEETKSDSKKQGTREAATVTFHEANKQGVDRGFDSTLQWKWSDYETAIIESKEIPKKVEPCKQIAVESNDRGDYTFAIDFYAGHASPFGLGLKGDHVVLYAARKNQIIEVHVIEDIEGILSRDCPGLRASKTWQHVGQLMNNLQKEIQRRAASGQEWTFNYNNYQTMQDSAGLGLGVSSAFVTWKEDKVHLGKEIS